MVLVFVYHQPSNISNNAAKEKKMKLLVFILSLVAIVVRNIYFIKNKINKSRLFANLELLKFIFFSLAISYTS